METGKLIRNWEELEGLESEGYMIEVENGCRGWILRKSDGEFMEYLSTHMFYGRNYENYAHLLQEYGFEVELENWDG